MNYNTEAEGLYATSDLIMHDPWLRRAYHFLEVVEREGKNSHIKGVTVSK